MKISERHDNIRRHAEMSTCVEIERGRGGREMEVYR